MGKFLIAALAALLAVPSAHAAETLPGPFPAEVLRVIDGDTFQARVHLWLGLDLTTFVRLTGIDAPELHGHCPGEPEAARAARDFLAGLLGTGPIHLTDVRFGKYAGRVVASVRLPSGEDIGAAMIAANHALPAARGRVNRCKETSR